MNVSFEQMLRIVGEQAIEIKLLQIENAALRAELQSPNGKGDNKVTGPAPEEKVAS